jgi:hypothetical protein
VKDLAEAGEKLRRWTRRMQMPSQLTLCIRKTRETRMDMAKIKTTGKVTM